MLARSLQLDDLEAFIQSMQTAGYRGHYIKDCVRAFQACLNWAVWPLANRDPRKILAVNPFAGHRLEIATGGTLMHSDSKDARLFLRWIWSQGRAADFPLHKRFNRRFVWMLHFLRLTGCRPKEAAQTRWTDIHWKLGCITLDATPHKTGRKTGRVRTIYFAGRAEKILRHLKAMEDRHPEFVFTHRLGRGAVARNAVSTAGEPWKDGTAIASKLRKFRTDATSAKVPGVEGFTAYLMRHGWITDALLEGGSITDVAKMAGNSPDVIARVYDHPVKKRLAARAKQLAAARQKSAKG